LVVAGATYGVVTHLGVLDGSSIGASEANRP
jgi:hypothetical protein